MHAHKHVHHLRRTPGLLSGLGLPDLLNPFTNDDSDPGSGSDTGGGDGSGSGGSSDDPFNDGGSGSGSSGDGDGDGTTPTVPFPSPGSATSGIGDSDNNNDNSGQDGATTVTQVVYQTESPTFEGPVAGYTTNDPNQAITAAPQPTDGSSDGSDDGDGGDTGDNGDTGDTGGTNPLPPMITSPANQDVPTDLPLDTVGPAPTNASPTQNPASGDGAGGAVSTSSSSADSASHNGQPSVAAKAGIAIGVLAAVLVVFLLAFLVFNRRRKSKERMSLEDDDEKINGSFRANDPPSLQPVAGAPQVSLRPVTEFLPLNMERRSSRGANMEALAPAAASGAIRRGQSAWERPVGSSHSNSPANPFGNQAERIPTPIAEEYSSHGRPLSPVSPITEKPLPPMHNEQPMHDPFSASDRATAGGMAAGAAAGAAAASNLTRKASVGKEMPKPLDLTVSTQAAAGAPQGSPTGTEFSMTSLSPGQAPAPSTSATAIAAAGGPTGSTVHRVQLDFKPTLEDEMELRAGQLVRLLHEYDDGWALCLRLDRSQQGVVPRTCLSTRPVKPRQHGPGPRGGPPINPNGPGARGPGPNYPANPRAMTPQGGMPYPRPESPMRPGTAPGYRTQSPAGGPMSPFDGRPASPAGGRPQSPGPRYHGPPGGRPMSPFDGRPASPAGGRPRSPGPRYQGPPGGRPMSPFDAQPASPAGGRPQSPGPRYQGPPGNRSQSPNGTSRRMTPPGPSPMNPQAGNGSPPQQNRQGPPTGPVGRKPVPGQAY